MDNVPLIGLDIQWQEFNATNNFKCLIVLTRMIPLKNIFIKNFQENKKQKMFEILEKDLQVKIIHQIEYEMESLNRGAI